MVEWRSTVGVICDKRIFTRVKGKIYITVRITILCESECWVSKVKSIHNISVPELRMLRWMCSHTRLDKLKNDYIR